MQRRRHFLQTLGLTGAAAWASQLPRARADRAGAGTRLIIVVANGGWDPTWVFDPKPDSSEVDTAPGQFQRYGELELWRTDSTPAVHSFFERWGSTAAVVNGMAVDSLVHEECMKRVLTGSSEPTVADLGARVASLGGAELPLPYLVQGATARAPGHEARAGMLGYAQQLSTLTTPGYEYPLADPMAAAFQPSAAEREAMNAWLEARAGAWKGQQIADADRARLDDYLESLARSRSIRDAAPRGFLSDAQLLQSYDPWRLATAALAESFCQVAFVEHDGYWDTHYDNDQQAGLFDGLFGDLDHLLTSLDGAGIFDDSLVLVLSEMGRSPVRNAGSGKDHWPFTSALLVGPRVRPGIVQATDADLQSTPIDPLTGQPDADGARLETADLLATVAHMMGHDAGRMYPGAEVLRAIVG